MFICSTTDECSSVQQNNTSVYICWTNFLYRQREKKSTTVSPELLLAKSAKKKISKENHQQRKKKVKNQQHKENHQQRKKKVKNQQHKENHQQRKKKSKNQQRKSINISREGKKRRSRPRCYWQNYLPSTLWLCSWMFLNGAPCRGLWSRVVLYAVLYLCVNTARLIRYVFSYILILEPVYLYLLIPDISIVCVVVYGALYLCVNTGQLIRYAFLIYFT